MLGFFSFPVADNVMINDNTKVNDNNLNILFSLVIFILGSTLIESYLDFF